MPSTSPLSWLTTSALPFWLKHGVDWNNGGFIEAFSPQGENLKSPRRALVQARQIYSFRIALENGWVDESQAREAIDKGSAFLVSRFSLPSGSFFYSVTDGGKPLDLSEPLYTQAFALFGLANAYAVLHKPELKTRAIALLKYLTEKRRLKAGGFTEIKFGKVLQEANPHMHLFEAFIAWMEVDKDPVWGEMAGEILTLCREKFIDSKTGLLAEYFMPDWKLILENGRFVAEPGHQYEWAWLMARYEKQRPGNSSDVQSRLFELSETFGISKEHGITFDEIWSDFTPKLKSSRAWPQCERIKCASALKNKNAADSAMSVLMRYFSTPTSGLWFDRIEETGKIRDESVKASSLYHIVGAFSEYNKLHQT